MSVITERPPARHKREPGTPPRSVVMLAALGLVGVTGAAIWLLPAQATPEGPSTAAVIPSEQVGTTTPVTTVPITSARPAGFLAFVDTARSPGFNLPATFRRTGVRWFTLGHLTSGGSGCTPRWGGVLDPGNNPVANRIGPLRAAGGDAGLGFGGAGSRELASSCADQESLTAAYRRVIGAFDATFVDFEIRDSGELATALRRARAVRDLQRESGPHGHKLAVTYTLPLGPDGLSTSDVEMLRVTRGAGAEIGTVNLLAAIEPHTAPAGRMRRLAAAIRAARAQVADALQLTDPAVAWQRLALTSVLLSAPDLGPVDARKLSNFATRTDMAWLSVRGATPEPAVSRVLWATRS